MQAKQRVQFEIRTSDGEEVRGVGEPGISEFVVGRKSTTAVQGDRVFIHDKFMSRRHCRVFLDDAGAWHAQDLDSANGTRLGGTALAEAVKLIGGEELRVGTAVVRITLLGEGEEATGDTQAAMTRSPVEEPDGHSETVVAEPGELPGGTSLLLDEVGATQPSVRARPDAVGGDDDATVFSGIPEDATDPELGADRTVPPELDDAETVYRHGFDETVARPGAAAQPVPEPVDPGAASGDADDEGSDDETEFAVGGADLTAPSARGRPAPETAPPEAPTRAMPDAATSMAPEADSADSEPATAPPDAPTAMAPEDEARAEATAMPRNEPASAPSAAPATAARPTAAPTARGGDTAEAMASATAATRISPDAEPLPGLTDDIPPALARNEMVRALLEQQLMDGYQVNELLREARTEGYTFFRAYVEREDTRPHFDQVYALVAEMRGLELIDDVDRLYDRSDDADWLKLELAERLGIVAMSDSDADAVHFATADPYDVTVRDWVTQATGKRAQPHLAYPTHISLVLQRLRNRSSVGDEEHAIVAVDLSPEKEDEIREHLADADAPQIVDYFIHRASMQGASDIHIEPTEERLVVRVRVDGVLHQDVALPAAYHAVVASRLKIMSGMDVAEKRRPQDGRIGVVVRGNPIDVRVSTYPTVYGEKVVMRLLDKNALRPSPETLGLLPRDLRVLKDAISAPYGLVMLCGPTGSGKTTTLYSCLGAIDKNQQNVLTVEDPVEYRLGGVHQMQVNHNIGLTFASGLRTMLRQDPDVIMVGECRDPETAGMAIQASLTGHVVFSTIHTNDAVGVVTRLIDMGIEPFLVGSSLSIAIAQRLVRVLCPDCKMSVTGEEILAQLAQDGVSEEKLRTLHIDVDPYLDYAEARGCRQCRNTGYIGRRAVFEVFEIDREARALISGPDFTDARLRELAQRKGMTTLVSHGLKLVEDENTTFAEVIRVLGETN